VTEDKPERLGVFYRIILRLPKLSLENLPAVMQGLFWVIILPIILIAECYLNFILLLTFPFPINLIVVAGVVLVFFVAVLRIMIERALNVLKMFLYPSRIDKDCEQLVQEYVSLLRKKKK